MYAKLNSFILDQYKCCNFFCDHSKFVGGNLSAWRQASKLIDDQSVCNQIPSLEHHRNVGCPALLYRYSTSNIRIYSYVPVPPVHQFNRSICDAYSAHPYVLKSIFCCTVIYRSFFFNRFTCFPQFSENYNLQKLKIRMYRDLSLSTLFPILSLAVRYTFSFHSVNLKDTAISGDNIFFVAVLLFFT